MKKSLYLIALGAALFCSCDKEVNPEPQTKKTVITVGIAGTKTTIGDAVEGSRPIYWANGDQLAANGTSSSALENIDEQSQTATFEFDGEVSTPAKILYPASAYKDEKTITLPAYQPSVGVLPMYAYAESLSSVEMNPLTAMLKLSLKKDATSTDECLIRKIVLSSTAQALSGDFTINYETGALSAVGDAGDCKLTANLNRSLSTDAIDIVLPIPAGEYTLRVEVIDELARSMVRTVTKTFTAGNFVNMPVLTFTPNSSAASDITISSADDWNAFATQANNNISAYSNSIINIDADLDFTGKDIVTLGDYNDDVYFAGTILGNGHSVKNLISSKEMIGAVASNGHIEGITFDSSCSYTVAFEAGTQKHFGPLTEYVKGTVKDCHNKANISLAAIEDVTPSTLIFVGGLVGRIREGEVIDCTNSGNITFQQSYTSTKSAYAGGICGYLSNAEGTIMNCTNNGQLTTSAYATAVYMGGIVGYTSGSVDGCTNNGKLSSSLTRPSGDACKSIYFAGIASYCADGSKIKNCSNAENGSIEFATSVKLLFAGGICGIVSGTMAEFTNNTNAAAITSTAGARQCFFGGLIGLIGENSENTFTLEGSPCSGAISISGYESSETAAYYSAGGLIAETRSPLTLQVEEGKTCNVAANITFAVEAKSLAKLNLGGLVGDAGHYGNSTIETAKFTAKGITASGYVKVNGGSSISFNPLYAAVGGIIGSAVGGADIQNCNNSAQVNFATAATAKANAKYGMIGGIAGNIEGTGSVIANCQNSGKVYSYHYNNNTWTSFNGNSTGGILGAFGHKNENTATISITNCTSTSAVYAYRGIGGGIAGFVDHATISGCSFTGTIERGAPAGGIAAVATNSEVNSCTVKSSKIATNGAGSCTGHAGGIIGEAQTCTIDGSKAHATITMANTVGTAGGIIGAPNASCTIGANSACSIGGNVNGTAVSESNCLALAVGNNNMTPTNVTYWDGN